MLVHELKTIAPLYLHLLKNNTTFRARAYSPDYSVRDFYAQQRMRNAVLRNQLRFSATKLFLHENALIFGGGEGKRMSYGRSIRSTKLQNFWKIKRICPFVKDVCYMTVRAI